MSQTGFWKKMYSDGTSCLGTDADVDQKKASWRRSKNTDMVAAAVSSGKNTVSIYSDEPREFWQSETYITDIGDNSGSVLVARRVMVKLKKEDRFYNLATGEHYCTVMLNDISRPSDSLNVQYFCMPKEIVGSWMVIELDECADKLTTQVYFSPRRV